MSKKPLIAEEEWARFNIREGKRVPRDRMPHCFGLFINSLPECNGTPGQTHNLCNIRHSCALAYAERLKLDVSRVYEGTREEGFQRLVEMIQVEERRINYTPEIGRKATRLEPKPQPQVEPSSLKAEPEEVTMDAVVNELAEAKPKPRPTTAVSIRDVIMSAIPRDGWASKADIVALVEQKLERKPLNPAVLHKISVVLLPKSQKEGGYTVMKEIRDRIHYYRMGGTNGQAKSE